MKEQSLQSHCQRRHRGVPIVPIIIGRMKVETKEGEGAEFIIHLLAT